MIIILGREYLELRTMNALLWRLTVTRGYLHDIYLNRLFLF